jgi:uncharacterized membrane protein
MKKNIQKFLIYSMGYFYLVAGVNHFVTPDFYLPLIPPFFSNPEFINILSGVAEILLGLGVLYLPTRKRAAWGIFGMLLCFIPSHVYFIQLGSCIEGGLCVPEWVGWVRLMVIHPILLLWSFWVSKNQMLIQKSLPKGFG